MGSLLFHVLSPKQLLIDDSYPEAYWGQDAEDLAPHIAEREPSSWLSLKKVGGLGFIMAQS